MEITSIKVPTLYEAFDEINRHHGYFVGSGLNPNTSECESVTVAYRDCGEIKKMTIEFAISENKFHEEMAKAAYEALQKGNRLKTFDIKGNDDTIYTFDVESFELVGFKDDSQKTTAEVHENALEVLENYQDELKEMTFHSDDEDGIVSSKKMIFAERRKAQAVTAYRVVWEAFLRMKEES